MRELTTQELALVVGGTGQCTPENSGSGNVIGGVTQPSTLGDDLVDIYEGIVQVTSHVIERVANAL